MATLLTSTTVIPSNLYHNSLTDTSSYLNKNKTTNNFTENSNLTKVYPSKLKGSSLETNEVNKKEKKTKINFVINSSLPSSNHAHRRSSSIKYIEKQNHNIKVTKNMTKVDKSKVTSNSEIRANNSQCQSKKVDSKQNSNINPKKLNNVSKKILNTNINNNSNATSIKNSNPKVNPKTNIKVTATKVLNLPNISSQSQNPRLQTGNVSRKIINIRNPKKSTVRPTITKLKLPTSTKENSNSLSLSKLSINNSYSNIHKRGGNNHLDKYFMNYSYNSDFSKKYRVKEEMGKGGFGLVFVAERITDGVEVAVKFIIKEKVPVSAWVKDPDLGVIPRECYLLKHVNHPCIIKYLDCYSDRKYFYLVTELHGSPWSKENIRNYQKENDPKNEIYTSFINAGALKTNDKFHIGKVRPSMDLYECIDSYYECFDEPQARYIFIQLLSAIKYLNSLNIIHRDIKDENILIDKDLNIKLIDFGAAIQINGGRVYDKFVGTYPYIAPEIMNGQEYGSISQDIYSLGVLLHLLIYGGLPDANLNESTTILFPQCTIKGSNCSEEVRDLIRWMLQKSPSLRPTLDEIFNHGWIKKSSN